MIPAVIPTASRSIRLATFFLDPSAYGFANGLGGNPIGLIVFQLYFAASVCSVDRFLHTVRDFVRVQNDFGIYIVLERPIV